MTSDDMKKYYFAVIGIVAIVAVVGIVLGVYGINRNNVAPAYQDSSVSKGLAGEAGSMMGDTKSRKKSICGNGICENGEADYCPPCFHAGTCKMPCRMGKCPEDCMPQSQLEVLDILLQPVFYANSSLDQTFPVGQMFDLDILISDTGGPGVRVTKLLISLNNKQLDSIKIPCEDQGDIILCGDRIWNAINVPHGKTTYTFNVIGQDISGKSFTKSKNIKLIFKEVNTSLCKELIPKHNKPKADRANIVFVGFGYQNVTGKTPQEALKLISIAAVDFIGKNNGLFSVEPFKSNKNKFNFWYIDKFPQIPDECVGTSDRCDQIYFMGPSLAENCVYGNKYIVGLGDGIFLSSSGDRVVGISIPLSPDLPFDKRAAGKLFTHEFGGHTFARLADEYVLYPDKIFVGETSTSIFAVHKNCYAGAEHTQAECLRKAPWKELIGNGCGKDKIIDCALTDVNYNIEIGCFEGCAKDGLGIFRPARNSIMNNADITPYSFGLWNEKLISDELNKISGRLKQS